MSNSNHIIIQGYLTKQGGSRSGFGWKNWKRRYFVFSTEGLTYYESDRSYLKGKRELGYIHCEGIVFSTANCNSAHYEFDFITPVRTMRCRADDQKTFNEWMQAYHQFYTLREHGSAVQMIAPQPTGGLEPNASPCTAAPQTFTLFSDVISTYNELAKTVLPSSLQPPRVSPHLVNQAKSAQNRSTSPGQSLPPLNASVSLSRLTTSHNPLTNTSISYSDSANSTVSRTVTHQTSGIPPGYTHQSISQHIAMTLPPDPLVQIHNGSLKEGYLFKLDSAMRAAPKARFFVLKRGVLEYYAHHTDRKPKGQINLNGGDVFCSAYRYIADDDAVHIELDPEEIPTENSHNPNFSQFPIPNGSAPPSPNPQQPQTPTTEAFCIIPSFCHDVPTKPNTRRYVMIAPTITSRAAWFTALHQLRSLNVIFPSTDAVAASLSLGDFLSSTQDRLALALYGRRLAETALSAQKAKPQQPSRSARAVRAATMRGHARNNHSSTSSAGSNNWTRHLSSHAENMSWLASCASPEAPMRLYQDCQRYLHTMKGTRARAVAACDIYERYIQYASCMRVRAQEGAMGLAAAVFAWKDVLGEYWAQEVIVRQDENSGKSDAWEKGSVSGKIGKKLVSLPLPQIVPYSYSGNHDNDDEMEAERDEQHCRALLSLLPTPSFTDLAPLRLSAAIPSILSPSLAHAALTLFPSSLIFPLLALAHSLIEQHIWPGVFALDAGQLSDLRTEALTAFPALAWVQSRDEAQGGNFTCHGTGSNEGPLSPSDWLMDLGDACVDLRGEAKVDALNKIDVGTKGDASNTDEPNAKPEVIVKRKTLVSTSAETSSNAPEPDTASAPETANTNTNTSTKSTADTTIDAAATSGNLSASTAAPGPAPTSGTVSASTTPASPTARLALQPRLAPRSTPLSPAAANSTPMSPIVGSNPVSPLYSPLPVPKLSPHSSMASLPSGPSSPAMSYVPVPAPSGDATSIAGLLALLTSPNASPTFRNAALLSLPRWVAPSTFLRHICLEYLQTPSVLAQAAGERIIDHVDLSNSDRQLVNPVVVSFDSIASPLYHSLCLSSETAPSDTIYTVPVRYTTSSFISRHAPPPATFLTTQSSVQSVKALPASLNALIAAQRAHIVVMLWMWMTRTPQDLSPATRRQLRGTLLCWVEDLLATTALPHILTTNVVSSALSRRSTAPMAIAGKVAHSMSVSTIGTAASEQALADTSISHTTANSLSLVDFIGEASFGSTTLVHTASSASTMVDKPSSSNGENCLSTMVDNLDNSSNDKSSLPQQDAETDSSSSSDEDSSTSDDEASDAQCPSLPRAATLPPHAPHAPALTHSSSSSSSSSSRPTVLAQQPSFLLNLPRSASDYPDLTEASLQVPQPDMAVFTSLVLDEIERPAALLWMALCGVLHCPALQPTTLISELEGERLTRRMSRADSVLSRTSDNFGSETGRTSGNVNNISTNSVVTGQFKTLGRKSVDLRKKSLNFSAQGGDNAYNTLPLSASANGYGRLSQGGARATERRLSRLKGNAQPGKVTFRSDSIIQSDATATLAESSITPAQSPASDSITQTSDSATTTSPSPAYTASSPATTDLSITMSADHISITPPPPGRKSKLPPPLPVMYHVASSTEPPNTSPCPGNTLLTSHSQTTTPDRSTALSRLTAIAPLVAIASIPYDDTASAGDLSNTHTTTMLTPRSPRGPPPLPMLSPASSTHTKLQPPPLPVLSPASSAHAKRGPPPLPVLSPASSAHAKREAPPLPVLSQTSSSHSRRGPPPLPVLVTASSYHAQTSHVNVQNPSQSQPFVPIQRTHTQPTAQPFSYMPHAVSPSAQSTRSFFNGPAPSPSQLLVPSPATEHRYLAYPSPTNTITNANGQAVYPSPGMHSKQLQLPSPRSVTSQSISPRSQTTHTAANALSPYSTAITSPADFFIPLHALTAQSPSPTLSALSASPALMQRQVVQGQSAHVTRGEVMSSGEVMFSGEVMSMSLNDREMGHCSEYHAGHGETLQQITLNGRALSEHNQSKTTHMNDNSSSPDRNEPQVEPKPADAAPAENHDNPDAAASSAPRPHRFAGAPTFLAQILQANKGQLPKLLKSPANATATHTPKSQTSTTSTAYSQLAATQQIASYVPPVKQSVKPPPLPPSVLLAASGSPHSQSTAPAQSPASFMLVPVSGQPNASPASSPALSATHPHSQPPSISPTSPSPVTANTGAKRPPPLPASFIAATSNSPVPSLSPNPASRTISPDSAQFTAATNLPYTVPSLLSSSPSPLLSASPSSVFAASPASVASVASASPSTMPRTVSPKPPPLPPHIYAARLSHATGEGQAETCASEACGDAARASEAPLISRSVTPLPGHTLLQSDAMGDDDACLPDSTSPLIIAGLSLTGPDAFSLKIDASENSTNLSFQNRDINLCNLTIPHLTPTSSRTSGHCPPSPKTPSLAAGCSNPLVAPSTPVVGSLPEQEWCQLPRRQYRRDAIVSRGPLADIHEDHAHVESAANTGCNRNTIDFTTIDSNNSLAATQTSPQTKTATMNATMNIGATMPMSLNTSFPTLNPNAPTANAAPGLHSPTSPLPRAFAHRARRNLRPLHTLPARLFARILTVFDHALISRVDPRELLDKFWMEHKEQAVGVVGATNLFNMRSRWVGAEILLAGVHLPSSMSKTPCGRLSTAIVNNNHRPTLSDPLPNSMPVPLPSPVSIPSPNNAATAGQVSQMNAGRVSQVNAGTFAVIAPAEPQSVDNPSGNIAGGEMNTSDTTASASMVSNFDNRGSISSPMKDSKSRAMSTQRCITRASIASQLLASGLSTTTFTNSDISTGAIDEVIASSMRRRRSTLGAAPRVSYFLQSDIAPGIDNLRMMVQSQSAAIARLQMVKFFIDVAYECHILQNFFSSFAIHAGLSSSYLHRLHDLWESLPRSSQTKLEVLQANYNAGLNYKQHRELFKLGSGKSQLPHMALICRDRFHVEDVFASRVNRVTEEAKLLMSSHCAMVTPWMSKVAGTDATNQSQTLPISVNPAGVDFDRVPSTVQMEPEVIAMVDNQVPAQRVSVDIAVCASPAQSDVNDAFRSDMDTSTGIAISGDTVTVEEALITEDGPVATSTAGDQLQFAPNAATPVDVDGAMHQLADAHCAHGSSVNPAMASAADSTLADAQQPLACLTSATLPADFAADASPQEDTVLPASTSPIGAASPPLHSLTLLHPAAASLAVNDASITSGAPAAVIDAAGKGISHAPQPRAHSLGMADMDSETRTSTNSVSLVSGISTPPPLSLQTSGTDSTISAIGVAPEQLQAAGLLSVTLFQKYYEHYRALGPFIRCQTQPYQLGMQVHLPKYRTMPSALMQPCVPASRQLDKVDPSGGVAPVDKIPPTAAEIKAVSQFCAALNAIRIMVDKKDEHLKEVIDDNTLSVQAWSNVCLQSFATFPLKQLHEDDLWTLSYLVAPDEEEENV